MEKCQNFKRFGKTLPDLLSFGGWVLVFAVLIMASQNTSGCYRAIGRVARRPIRRGVQQVDEMVPVIPRSKSAPNLVPKPKRPNTMDRDPSDAISIAHTDAIRRTKSLDRSPPEFFKLEEPARLPELEEFTGIAELKELLSFADFEELAESLELPECPSWDQL